MSGFIEARPRVGYYYSGKSKNKLVSDFTSIYNKRYMSLPVIVKEDMTIYDAICTIFLEDTGTLFITNQKDELIGVSSKRFVTCLYDWARYSYYAYKCHHVTYA